MSTTSMMECEQNFSLLHVPASEFAEIVTGLHHALKPDGEFHLGKKTGEGAGRDRLGRYYAYYSREELAGILRAARFEIDSADTGEDRGSAGDISFWIALSGLTKT